MARFTREGLQAAGIADGVIGDIMATQQQLDDAEKVKGEVEGGLKKIMSVPKAKKAFQAAIKEAGLELQIPKQPWEEELEAARGETADVTQKFTKFTEEQSIRKTMSDMGIPWNEVEKVIEFQTKHKIGDNISAIELYAAQREPELPQVNHVNFKAKEGIASEDEARASTLAEIRQLKGNRR